MKNFIFVFFIMIMFRSGFTDQNITIVGGNNISTPPIAIMPFTSSNESTNNIANIITDDLNISGDVKAIIINSDTQIESKINYIVTGRILGNVVEYYLKLNDESKSIILNNSIPNNSNVRLVAHTISNEIYQKITNTPGIFTSKIAYIAKDKSRYNLVVTDYDGFNPKTIISTKSILSSLAWHPNGSQIAYVSFEKGKPVIYVQNLYAPKRYVVANFSGSNSAPNFSADGSQLVVTLTKDEGSQLYLVDNAPFTQNTTAYPLFNNFGSINTEAFLSKNNNIVFTSDHDGGPQIFSANLMEKQTPKRLTFNLGNYNTTARLSHNNTKLTFIHRNNGTLRTYVQDLTTGANYPVSIGTSLDISPSFAPNDKLILFSSNNRMYITNTTGTTQTKLDTINTGQIIDQRWSDNFK